MAWDFGEVNYLAVLAVIVVGFPVGMAWYGLLAKPWLKAAGITNEEARKAGPLAYISSVVASALLALSLAILMQNIGGGWEVGLGLGLLAGVGIAAPNVVMHNMFAVRRNLALIDATHTVVVMAIAGLIIGAWQ